MKNRKGVMRELIANLNTDGVKVEVNTLGYTSIRIGSNQSIICGSRRELFNILLAMNQYNNLKK